MSEALEAIDRDPRVVREYVESARVGREAAERAFGRALILAREATPPIPWRELATIAGVSVETARQTHRRALASAEEEEQAP